MSESPSIFSDWFSLSPKLTMRQSLNRGWVLTVKNQSGHLLIFEIQLRSALPGPLLRVVSKNKRCVLLSEKWCWVFKPQEHINSSTVQEVLLRNALRE